MMLKRMITGVALAAIGTAAFAFDLNQVKTRVLGGLEGPSTADNISSVTFGNTRLALEGIEGLTGRNLRTRFWTINSVGVVPIHDHSNRPAVFTVLTGEIFEYTTKTAHRIQHGVGNLAVEEGGAAHWWLNTSDETVYLIAFDVFAPRNSPKEATPVPAAAPGALPEAKGAAHELLGAVNFGRHFEDDTGEGWVLSTYRTTIEPGGVFPSFVAAGEPLHAFVWDGEVTEYRGDTAEVIPARIGTAVDGGATVWWENTGDAPAVLFFGVVEPEAEIEGVPRTAPLAHGHHKD